MTVHRSRYCARCRAVRNFDVESQAGFIRWLVCLTCGHRTRATDRTPRPWAGI